MAADPLSLIPPGPEYNNLRAILTLLKKDFPEKYAGLAESRVSGWVEAIDNNTRTDDSIRDDIAEHIMTKEGIMEVYGVSDEEAANLILGANNGGSDFADIGKEDPGGAGTQALPRNSKLVRIGNKYRVVWDLGDGLGWAWYDISPEQLQNIYDTKTPTAHFTLANMGQFEQRFGNNYWGNIAEVDLKAEDPWEDLKTRIFAQFGFVPGFDDPEIRRLMIQGYFETWSQNEFTVAYSNTQYFNTLTNHERAWYGLSEEEKSQRIREQAAELTREYFRLYGQTISADDESILDAAQKIQSGQMTLAEWRYNNRLEAEKIEESPASREIREEEERQLEEGNQIENLTRFAEAQWRAWVGGGIPMPANFAANWGARLASGEVSEADLESYLKSVSSARWTNKPADVSWEDWASTYKSQIRDTLELGTLDDNDKLLGQILNSDLDGVDLERMIRADSRYLGTRAFGGSVASYAEQLGRDFGYIA